MRVLMICCAFGAMLAPACFAQVANAPRTPDNHPDFSGIWESRWITPLERMRGAQAVSVDEATARQLVAGYLEGMGRRPGNANPDSDMDYLGLVPVDGQFRTSLVVEPETGAIPFTPTAEAAIERLFKDPALDNPEERDASERCTAGQGRAPMISPPANGYMQITQTAEHLVILTEGLNDVRIIPMSGVKPDIRLVGTQGVSVARWEGDVFVVETTDFRKDDVFRVAPPSGILVLSPQSRVIERFELISPHEFRYRFTVTDSSLYSAPWTAETTYLKTSSPMFEYACHEGNYALTNILQGGRRTERGNGKPLK